MLPTQIYVYLIEGVQTVFSQIKVIGCDLNFYNCDTKSFLNKNNGMRLLKE